MPILHTVGVDPGLVHTGCVRIMLDRSNKRISIGYTVIDGIDSVETARWVHQVAPSPRVFVEKYVPRSNFGTDERMVQGEAELRKALSKAEFLRNTGIRTVVTPQVLGALGLAKKFSVSSHHQDLLSAARIAVLGMMKDKELNRALADVVMDHIDGRPWQVAVFGGSRAR